MITSESLPSRGAMAMPMLVPTRDLVIAEIEGFAERLSDFLGEGRGLHGRVGHVVDHRELVAAQPGDQRGFRGAFAQPRGDGAQQGVTGRMSKRVVDLLEAIEIEHEHGQINTAIARNRNGVFHPLPEQHAIWQIGQRIVLRHMSDLGLGPALLGDIEMRGHPPAAGHWLSRHADQPSIARTRRSCSRSASNGNAANFEMNFSAAPSLGSPLRMPFTIRCLMMSACGVPVLSSSGGSP